MDITRYQDMQDNYILCPQCCIFVFEYCAIHGPPLVIPDTEVSKSPLPRTLPHAALTIPHAFLHVALSIIPGAGLGVFSSRRIPPNVRFGPYRGRRMLGVTSTYCWQVFLNNEPAYVIDASEENNSNWMRYINCSRHFQEQNLVAYQHRGQIFYRTIKPIEPFTELLVFYGSEFAKLLGIDLRKYNRDDFYLEITQGNYGNKEDYFQNEKEDSVENRTENDTINTTETICNNVLPIIKHIDSKEDTNEKKNIKNCHIQDVSKINKNNIINNEGSKRNVKETRKEKFMKYLTCDICDKSFNYIAEVTNHILNHTEKSFSCTHCEYETDSKSCFKTHIKVKHTQNNPFSCSYCEYTTSYKQRLKMHINGKHEKKISFNCYFCNFTTCYKCNLNQHIKVKHTQNNKYSCSYCEYTTSYKHELKMHINGKHEKKISFNCSFCNFTTCYKRHLNQHIKAKHTQNNKYSCSYCEYTTSYKFYLNKHINGKHEKKISFNCSLCNYITNYKCNLNRHIKEKHNKCKI